MVLKNRLLLGLAFTVAAFAACERTSAYDEGLNQELDEVKIKKWLDSTGLAFIRHESGVYYRIDTPGSGGPLQGTDTLYTQYTGKLFTDSVFSRTTGSSVYKVVLNSAIPGWQKGLPQIRKGGTIQLLVPSPLAYRDQVVGTIPANSPLYFLIYLSDVKKKITK